MGLPALTFIVDYSNISYTVSQEDPHRTVQAFIDLIQRHEQSFYHFVHKVHSKGESLFNGLMQWIELFLTVVREGLGEPISLEFLLPHTGQERADILAEVDKVALYHYKLKVAYEGKLRRRFGKAQNGADAEDEATQELVNGVVEEINFGELMQGDVDDVAAEETNSESDDDDSSTSESTSNEDDESDDSEDTTSDESIPRRRPPVRSQTTSFSLRSTPTAETQPPIQRTQTQSLRSSRSMNFLLGRRGGAPAVPPVPSIPPAFHQNVASSWSKPLSPSPTLHSPPEHPPLPPSKVSHEPQKQNAKAKGKGKKSPETLKPPDLQHIPQLLPVFVEMVRFIYISVMTFRFTFVYGRCDPCSVHDRIPSRLSLGLTRHFEHETSL